MPVPRVGPRAPARPAASRPPTDKAGAWLRRAAGEPLRIEARISDFRFAPHRHDTYAVALTLDGVQRFDYCGATRQSLPGGVVVLHPDERHDGRPGTPEGFRYCAIHIQPAAIQHMLGGRELPFLAGGTSRNPSLLRPVQALLADYHRPLGKLEFDDALVDFANALATVSKPRHVVRSIDQPAAERARDYMLANWDSDVSLACLERASGRDRWKLSRDFRVLFGTSPYRYLLMRRLEHARALLAEGHAPVEAAAACCFADQSHLTRHFRSAYGFTPGNWPRCT
jgi:AraC-like DNA-binding protein